MPVFVSTLYTIFSTFCIALVARLCWLLWCDRRMWLLARTLKYTTPALPLVGHGYHCVKGLVDVTQMVMKEMQANVAKSRLESVFWLGTYPLITVSNPKDIQIILNNKKSIDGGVEHELFHFIFGNGLLTAPADIWKTKRRLLSPVFRPDNLSLLLSHMNQCGMELADSLSKHATHCDTVDVSQEVFYVALKATYALIFGSEKKIDIHSEKFELLAQAVKRAARLLRDRIFKTWALPDFVFQWLYKSELSMLEEEWRYLLRDEVKEQTGKAMEQCNGNEKGNRGQKTLIDTFCTLEKSELPFTEKDVQQETMTFLVTGADTTTTSLSSCLLALAAHPQVQDRLYAEIQAVVGEGDSDVSLDHLRAMPYLDQVLKESLRKFSPIMTLSRRVQDDLKLSFGTIPAGGSVMVSMVGVHFDPRNYPDPDKFDPERFRPEAAALREKHSFIPFSGGPRNCIGKNFATMAMKTWLVHVMRQYELCTDVDLSRAKFVAGFSTSLEHGYPIKIKRRQPLHE